MMDWGLLVKYLVGVEKPEDPEVSAALRGVIVSLRWLTVSLLVLAGVLFVLWTWETNGIPSWARR